MFTALFLCAAAWCALFFATGHAQASEPVTKTAGLFIKCKVKPEGAKYRTDQIERFGNYNFACIKVGKETRVGLSVEGTEKIKKLSGLGGSSAWCRYDGEEVKGNFNCTARRARSLISAPKDACTLYVQNDGTLWFSTKVDGTKSVRCFTSGLYGQLQFSFKAEKADKKNSGPKNVSLFVSSAAAEPFLAGFNASTLPDAEHFPELEEKNSRDQEAKEQKAAEDHSAAKLAGKQEGVQAIKPSDASGGTAQQEEGDESTRDTQGMSAGEKTTEADASRAHANAVVAFSLSTLLVRLIAA